MNNPIKKLLVWTTIPLAAYALIDIAANIRGLEDKFNNFLSGYSVIANHLYTSFPALEVLPRWVMAYIAMGIIFKFSLIMLKLLHPYEKQPSWYTVLITTVRHVLVWPIILFNFLAIGIISYRRGDYSKAEEKLSSKNYDALMYVKSIYQYIGCVLFMSVLGFVAIGAW